MKISSIGFLALFFTHTMVFAADAETDKKLRSAIAPIVQSLPMQVDKRTTLTSIMLEPDHVLTYRYSVDMEGMLDDAAAQGNLTRAQLKAGLERRAGSGWTKLWAEQYIFPYIVKSNCTQPSMQSMLKLGYSINHTMADSYGNYLFERAVTRSDCNF